MDDIKNNELPELSTPTDSNKNTEHSQSALSNPKYDDHCLNVSEVNIGSKVFIKGTLIGEENITIQGRVEGKIDLKNNDLIIGESAKVKANVAAKNITIEGNVQGNICGVEKVIISQSSKINGNVLSQRVSLAEGANFLGSIRMDVKSEAINV